MRRSAKPGRMKQLCNSLLHKFRGATTSAILDHVNAPAACICYAKATIQHGWSRDVLVPGDCR